MASVEIFGLLCAGSVRYHPAAGSSGYQQLSRLELAGLLSGLARHQVDFGFARYGCDVDSERRLIAHVRVWLADVALRQDWQIVKGRPTLCNLAAIAVFEMVRPNRCERCRGRGMLVNRVCPGCHGGSYQHLSGRDIAESIGVDECNYRRTWKGRYETALKYIQDIDFQIKSVLYRADIENLLEPSSK